MLALGGLLRASYQASGPCLGPLPTFTQTVMLMWVNIFTEALYSLTT